MLAERLTMPQFAAPRICCAREKRDDDMLRRRFSLAAVTALLLGASTFRSSALAADPAYEIVLRSRHAQVTPAKFERAQTGAGSILVAQPEPNTVIITMGGSAVVGSGCKASSAAIHFDLAQDLDIAPRRAGVRPPRVGMIGRVVGTLQLTDPGRASHEDGLAAQGPAAACLLLGGTTILSVGTEPSTVSCGQKLSINHQCGPVEAPAVATSAEYGCYRLTSTFDIGANQGKGVFNRRYAVADFDPAPQLDPFWADALKPFRAVPRSDFGFTLVVRVVEDPLPKTTAAN